MDIGMILPVIGMVLILIAILIRIFRKQLVEYSLKREEREEGLRKAIGYKTYNKIKRRNTIEFSLIIIIGTIIAIVFFLYFRLFMIKIIE